MHSNEIWSKNIISKIDPDFRHRWEIYTDTLLSYIDKDCVWIDCGAGKNGSVKAHGHLAKKATGVDIQESDKPIENYIAADIKSLPFAENSADLITLRFVAEHFDKPREYFNEIERVLKPGGKTIVLTTNIASPVIFIPKLLLPYRLRHWVLTRLFKVEDEDVFPTYHQINTAKAFARVSPNLKVRNTVFISDLNYVRRPVFLLLFAFHIITMIPGLKRFRTNILTVLEKA